MSGPLSIRASRSSTPLRYGHEFYSVSNLAVIWERIKNDKQDEGLANQSSILFPPEK